MNVQVSLVTIRPCRNTKCAQEGKEQDSSSLSENYIWSFYGLLPEISLQKEISDQRKGLHSVQRTENWTSSIGFVLIWLSSQCCEHLSNRSDTSLLIWNTTKNSVYPQEIPFGYDMGRSGVGVCRDIIVGMPQSLRIKADQKTSGQPQSQCSTQIFRVKVRQGSEGGPLNFHKLPSEPYVIVSHHTALQYFFMFSVCT